MPKYRIGIDVGGTFTDYLCVNDAGISEIYKVPSTYPDPSIGTMKGLNDMAINKNVPLSQFLSEISLIVHGTTITTNMVLTGSQAKTGFITVKGFRDYVNERRGRKRTLFTPKESPPAPLVPRYLIQCVGGRIDCEGKEFIPLDENDVYEAIDIFKKEKVEAIAVSLFFSFLNPSHELRVKEIIEKEMPEAYVCVSHQVLPQVRIYERASTTIFNAAVAPGLRLYINNLLAKLTDNGFCGNMLLMQSNGGVMSPEMAMNFAVNTLLSGPAGGPKAALFYSEAHNIQDIISVDMGGTSFDACLIRNGEPEITIENDVAEYRTAVPSLAIHSIGAGGGSIAWVDSSGILQVGPRSAGANPGPACYDAGGDDPTVSDADLILGYLNPDYFLGGKKKLYPAKAEEAIRKKVAQPLKLDLHHAASAIYKIINMNMAQGIKMASIRRGYDPRACALVVAGGAGPVHACDIAKELEMKLLLIPKTSSAFCATGMLVSDLKHDYVRSCYALMKEGQFDAVMINSLLQQMEDEGRETLAREGVLPDKIEISYYADLRYLWQLREVEVPFPRTDGSFTPKDIDELHGIFDQKHRDLYGYDLPDIPLELICLRAKVKGIIEKPRFKDTLVVNTPVSSTIKGHRKIFYNDDFITVPIHDGRLMGHGHQLVGPAIIEEPTTTILVTTGYQMICDKYGSYLVFAQGEDLNMVLDNLTQY